MITVNKTPIALVHFPDGTLLFHLPFVEEMKEHKKETVFVKWDGEDIEELFALYCLKRTLKERGFRKADLELSFNKEAFERINRVFVTGAFKKFMKSMNWDTILITENGETKTMDDQLFDTLFVEYSYNVNKQAAIRIENVNQAKDSVTLSWKFKNNRELFELYNIAYWLKQNTTKDLSLQMPYIPNARQDRVKHPDDILTAKYFGEIINQLDFDEVLVFDPHSEVCVSHIEAVKIVTPHNLIRKLIKEIGLDESKDVILYPDAGCAKRLNDELAFPYLIGDKNRDWKTGRIMNYQVYGEVPSKPFNALIVDDICSKGTTFHFAAETLKELGADNIYLYISHCENTVLDGQLMTDGLLTKIYTTNSLYSSSVPIVEVMAIETLFEEELKKEESKTN